MLVFFSLSWTIHVINHIYFTFYFFSEQRHVYFFSIVQLLSSSLVMAFLEYILASLGTRFGFTPKRILLILLLDSCFLFWRLDNHMTLVIFSFVPFFLFMASLLNPEFQKERNAKLGDPCTCDRYSWAW